MISSFIEAINLKKSYGGLHILKGVNLKIGQGEVVSIVGPSGAGKMTLLHILDTHDRASEGIVW